ncbi:hypothetical protein CR513_51842, partial [Mucuna pruriens]
MTYQGVISCSHSNDEKGGKWNLDNGCSNHVAKDRSLFKNIDDFVKVKVQLRNDTIVDIGQMMEKGYVIHFEGDICTIFGNYNRRWEIVQLWHQRFGHFKSQALKLLYQKNMTRDMPCLKENNEAYEGCLLRKQHKMTWTYFIKEKLDVFGIFKKFKALVEKQSEKL